MRFRHEASATHDLNLSWALGSLLTRYLVLAEGHHASVGCIGRGEDVWRVVSSLHAVVELGELTHPEGTKVCFKDNSADLM